MKFKFKYLVLIMISLFVGISVVNAKTMNVAEIENNTYVIGTHVFTRNTNDNYNGELTIQLIMLAAKTIEGNSLEDMVIYYKNARGNWIDGVTGDAVTMPESVSVQYVDIELDDEFSTYTGTLYFTTNNLNNRGTRLRINDTFYRSGVPLKVKDYLNYDRYVNVPTGLTAYLKLTIINNYILDEAVCYNLYDEEICFNGGEDDYGTFDNIDLTNNHVGSVTNATGNIEKLQQLQSVYNHNKVQSAEEMVCYFSKSNSYCQIGDDDSFEHKVYIHSLRGVSISDDSYNANFTQKIYNTCSLDYVISENGVDYEYEGTCDKGPRTW